MFAIVYFYIKCKNTKQGPTHGVNRNVQEQHVVSTLMTDESD